MAVKLLSTESAVSVAAGAADYAIATKVAGTGPGKIPWSIYYELGLIVAGNFHRKIGLGAEIGDPMFLAGLVLAGRRATALAMAGKLFTPQSWQGVGGEGEGGGGDAGFGDPSASGGSAMRTPGAASTRGGYGPVGVRVLGAAPTYALPPSGASFSLYSGAGSLTEAPGAAG